MQIANIREQMEIVTADGKCLGRVAYVDAPDQIGVSGSRHPISLNWITWVDGDVYLSKTRQQVISAWDSMES
jgi:hypothetical protein